MRCSDIRKLLTDYVDGSLSQRDSALVETHLASCKACAQELTFLKTYINEAGSMEKVKAPEDFLERVHQRLKRRFSFEKIMRTLFVPVRVKIPLELAGVAATVILALFIFRNVGPEEHAKIQTQPEVIALVAGPGSGVSEEYGSACMAPSPDVGEHGGWSGYGVESRELAKKETLGNEFLLKIVSDVKKIVEDLKGYVTSEVYDERTGLVRSIVVEIPSTHYETFLEELERFGSVLGESESVAVTDKEKTALRINFK